MKSRLFLVLMAAAAAILVYQLFIPPIVGMADQGDFIRTIRRFGYGPQHQGSLEYQYVEPKFVRDPHARDRNWEQANSEYLFVGAAVLLNNLVSKDGALDITVIGLVHALAFLAVFAQLLRVTSRERTYVLLWIAALVALTDAGYAAYWNSFYAEPASCIFFLLLLAESVEIARAGEISASSALRWSLWAILWVWAKPQNTAVGLILGLFSFRLAFWTRPLRNGRIARLIAVGGGCGILGCAAFNVIAMPRVGHMANTYGMVFSGILPESKNPAADLRALGLDPELARFARTGAWSPVTDFPALAESGVLETRVTTFSILRFYLLRPARLWRRLHGVLPVITSIETAYGNFEPSAGLPPLTRTRAFRLWSGFHGHVLAVFSKWIVFALAAWPLAAVWLWVRQTDCIQRRRIELLTLLPLGCLAALFGAVFGDAFDLIKHLFLFNLWLDACVIYAVAAGWQWAISRRDAWKVPGFMRWSKVKGAWVAPAALVVAFYVWTCGSTGDLFQFTRRKPEYYTLLTDAFRSHHLYLTVAPVPQLLALSDPYDPAANAAYRAHDLSLYHGKYYMYFGPAPVLTLFLPWHYVTGRRVAEDTAALIYLTVGYIFSLLLLRLLLHANDIRPSRILIAAAVLTLGMGQFGVVTLRDPVVYGVAITAGYCFFAAGMYCLARLIATHNRLLTRAAPNRAATVRERWLAITAGVLIGLTPGCRPQYALAAVLLCAVYIYFLREGQRWEAIWFVAPIAVSGLLLMWYNFARFGNPFEFGTTYQLAGSVSTRGVSLRLGNLARGLYYLLLFPPALAGQFPYIAPRYVPPAGNLFVENAVGLLAISPAAVAGLAFPIWAARWKGARDTRLILAALYGAAVVVLICTSLTGFAVGRYLIDFAPAFLEIALFAWLYGAMRTRLPSRRVAAAVVIGGGVWSTAMGAALSVGYNDFLRDHNPAAYRTLASWFGQSSGDIRLPVDAVTMTAAIRFPARAAGWREALLDGGRPGAEDCLFVEYTGAGQVRFGYEKAGAAVTLSSPVAITLDRDYRLDVWYSSAAQRVVVSLDGAAVWNQAGTWSATSVSEMTIGRAPASMPDVHPFSGLLRVPPRGGILYAAGQAAAFR